MAIPIPVTFDCADPARLAPFWAAALGYKLQDPPEGYDSWPAFLQAIGIPKDQWNRASAIVDPEDREPRIYNVRPPYGVFTPHTLTLLARWHIAR